MMMKWTKEKPKKFGYYWHKSPNGIPNIASYFLTSAVRLDGASFFFRELEGDLWSDTPIEPPAE